MSDFSTGFANGFARSTAFGNMLLFNRMSNYYASQPYYASSLYCDLDQPTGLSSVLDGGWAINRPYYTTGFTGTFGYPFGLFGTNAYTFGGMCGYTGFSPFGLSSCGYLIG